jgi:type VI secretion system secreted protein VgrG
MADDLHIRDDIDLGFASGALSRGALEVRGVHGRERISQLFELDLLLVAPGGPLSRGDLDAFVSKPCAVALGPDPGDVVRGVISSVIRLDTRGAMPRYVARMVPTVALLGLSRHSRVFQGSTVVDMTAQLLALYSMRGDRDFELRVTPGALHPEREYVVQYQESDWDFLQRWLEHEGMFYWFEHGGQSERLVMADANSWASPLPNTPRIAYRGRNNLASGRDPTVWGWQATQQRVPARVLVHDYNYRTPHLAVSGQAHVDGGTGFGSVITYGEHCKTSEESGAVAAWRAERLACERRTFSGHSDCSKLRVGHVLVLDGHDEQGNDGQYLITAVEYKVGRRFTLGASVDEDDAITIGEERPFAARFEAIPIDVPFRPEQRTPWPSIHGVMHAHIDADTDGTFAQIDDLGRYKVKMPYDLGTTRGTKASRWIRMAQAYAGPGYGTHHPLHKGTEVLLAHVDGDPDRPIIVGSVPNAHTVSPSTGANATQSVMQTASGIRIVAEDLQT